MTSADDAQLAAELDRIARLSGLRPSGGTVVAALRRGEPLAAAAASGGLPPALCRALEALGPVAGLEVLANAMERYQHRRRLLRATGHYAITLGALTTLVALVLSAGALPAIAFVTEAHGGDRAVPSHAWMWGAVAVSLCLTAWIAIATTSAEPLPPVRSAHLAVLRAFLLQVAAAWSKAGAVPVALRAAAQLGPASARVAGEETARTLETGAGAASPALFGELGAGVFLSAAKTGAAVETLSALAEVHEAVAQRSLPTALRRAEVLAIAAAALGVCATAAAFVLAYSSTILGRS